MKGGKIKDLLALELRKDPSENVGLASTLTYKSSDKNAKQLVNKLRLISEEQANTHTHTQTFNYKLQKYLRQISHKC